MRRHFPAILGAILILAAAAVTLGWMLQSAHVKQSLEENIAAFNAGPVQFTYDRIDTSGFPMQLVVSIVNPKLNGRMDLLLDPNKQQKLPEWNETAALQGMVQINIGALSSDYGFSLNGLWKNTSTINGQAVSLAGKTETTSQCALKIDRIGGWVTALWNTSALQNSGANFLMDFRLLDCALGELTLVDANGATLLHSGPQRIYVNSDKQGDKRQVRFYLKGADTSITQDGDKTFAVYARAFSPEATPPMLSAYGTQNMEVDFTYIGPVSWQGDPRAMPIEAHLGIFTLSNAAYSVNATFDLTNSADTKNQSSRVAFKSEASYNEIYSALLHDTVRGMIAQLLSDQKMTPSLPPSVKNTYTPESLYALIAPAIPDFHALGKFTTALDLSYQGSAGFTAGDFMLSQLELSVAPYGLTGNGSGKRAPGALLPALSLMLHCRNCIQMVGDILGYANRIQSIAAALTPETKMPTFDSATINGYKGFLQSIAVDDAAGNFNYEITSDGKLGITVNHKRMDEVLVLYHKYLPQPH